VTSRLKHLQLDNYFRHHGEVCRQQVSFADGLTDSLVQAARPAPAQRALGHARLCRARVGKDQSHRNHGPHVGAGRLHTRGHRQEAGEHEEKEKKRRIEVTFRALFSSILKLGQRRVLKFVEFFNRRGNLTMIALLIWTKG